MRAGKMDGKTLAKLLIVSLLGLIAVTMLGGIALAKSPDVIRVGVLQEPKSLNLWLASDAWSKRVLNMIYQPLYIRDPKTQKLVPWLAAEEPEYDGYKIAYTVKLRPAKWSDGSEFTSADVIFTGNMIKKLKMPRFNSKWKFVKKIIAIDKHTVQFVLKKPKAIFLTRTLTTPIVQKKQWEKILASVKDEKKPLKKLLRYKLKKPVGTGPFVLANWKRGVFIYLKRNPHFFGLNKTVDGMALGPRIKGIIFKVFGTADAAVLALRKGDIDFYWNGLQAGYLEQIKDDPKIKIYTNKKSALYFMGFNLRKAPFNDVNLRRAIATLVDKDFIITRILQGYGDVLHSLIPPGNQFYYNPNVPRYGYGKPAAERIKMAYGILKEAGYTWKVPPVNDEGKAVKGKGIILPDGKPMKEFTILTPPADYDPHRAMSGQMIQEWLRAVGLPASSQPMAFGALIQKVKGQRDFDCFILGYGKLSLDPGYLRAFFHSKMDKPRGWNMSGYKSFDFDHMSNSSNDAMDPIIRQEMIHKMQVMLMRDVPYIPLYNPLLVEGVRSDRFTGWVPAVGGIGNLWSFCQIKPVK